MLRLTWNITGAGWAELTAVDQDAETTVVSSFIVDTPTHLLAAVARVITSESDARVDIEAEPAASRLILRRDRGHIGIRILQLPGQRSNDAAGTEVWASRQPVDTVARAVIRCFDNVATTYGEDDYHRQWRRPFPRTELEAVRTTWRAL